MEYIYLTQKEFAVLLSAVGCKKWNGVLDETIFEKWDVESEINEILISLYQKEMIEWENGKAAIAPDVRRIFDLLKEIRQYVHYARLDDEYPEEYLYVRDTDVVRIRSSIHEKDRLRLAFQPLKQVEQEMWENGIFPVNTENFEEKLPLDCPDIEADVEMLIKNNIVLVFEKKEFEKQKPISRFLVKEKGLYNFFYLQKEDEIQVYYDRKEAIEKIFDKWIREQVEL